VWEYLAKSATAFVLGFAPFVEIYLAIPAAVAMGLDYASAAIWCAVGNFLPVPMIVYFHETLMRVRTVGPWLQRLSTGRARRILNRHGPVFLIFATPWISVWPVAAAAATLGMNRRKVMFYIFISVFGHAIVLSALIALGVDFATSD
jgi:uncharacterized membrane protein